MVAQLILSELLLHCNIAVISSTLLSVDPPPQTRQNVGSPCALTLIRYCELLLATLPAESEPVWRQTACRSFQKEDHQVTSTSSPPPRPSQFHRVFCNNECGTIGIVWTVGAVTKYMMKSEADWCLRAGPIGTKIGTKNSGTDTHSDGSHDVKGYPSRFLATRQKVLI